MWRYLAAEVAYHGAATLANTCYWQESRHVKNNISQLLMTRSGPTSYSSRRGFTLFRDLSNITAIVRYILLYSLVADAAFYLPTFHT